MAERPKIVILNGLSSVGKSSTAKALQGLANRPLLHAQGDTFLEMLPEEMFNHPDGITIQRNDLAGLIAIDICFGPAITNLIRGFRHSIAALAREGNNLVVDDVMLNPADQLLYREVLIDFDVTFVGLFAPLDTLEKREGDRKDRLKGLVKWQFDRVHHGIEYDLTIETVGNTPIECARQIAAVAGL
jgi:chloramphenicol 3-O phosphotransferase